MFQGTRFTYCATKDVEVLGHESPESETRKSFLVLC